LDYSKTDKKNIKGITIDSYPNSNAILMQRWNTVIGDDEKLKIGRWIAKSLMTHKKLIVLLEIAHKRTTWQNA
jgi:hypothetical protein